MLSGSSNRGQTHNDAATYTGQAPCFASRSRTTHPAHPPKPRKNNKRKDRMTPPVRWPYISLLERCYTANTATQRTIGACCVGSTPNLFLLATLAAENLSSGEKRAGCADSVSLPSGFAFCTNHKQTQHIKTSTARQAEQGESHRERESWSERWMGVGGYK